MGFIVCRETAPYYYKGDQAPLGWQYGTAEEAHVYNSEGSAAAAAASLTDHWYLQEDIARSANPNTNPPRPKT